MNLFQKLLRRFNSTTRDPSKNFLDAMFGGVSFSGTRVSQDTALGVATVFACVSLLSRVMSTLPLKLYERDGDRRREASEHPVAMLLGLRTNPESTATDVRGAMMANLALRGEAFAKIIRNRRGQPRELWPIHSTDVNSYRDRNGLLRYRVTDGSTPNDIPFANMLHIRGLTLDGIAGFGPLPKARECLGLAIALEDNASQFFGNQSRPGMVLEAQGPVTEQQRDATLKQMADEYRGVSNAYKTLILSNAYKVATAATRATNEQAQFDESRNRQAVEVCKLFGVPPHKVGILDKATFSNIEQQQIQFCVDTIGPLCVQWEQAMAGALLDESERGRFFLKHNLNALQRGDFETRILGYTQMIQWGIASPNECRALEDMDPREGGDAYLTPLNMATNLDGAPKPKEKKPPAPTNRINGEHSLLS